MPEGLRMAVLERADLSGALEELRPRLLHSGGVLEVGLSYKQADTKRRLRTSLPSARVPQTTLLTSQATEVLGCAGGTPERLSVIVRQYQGIGSRLAFHRDAIGIFGEEACGLVLHRTGSAPALTFRKPRAGGSDDVDSADGADGLDGVTYTLREVPGLAFVLAGPARYVWAHGVPPASDDTMERISITWRWFREDFVHWISAGDDTRARWVASFVRLGRARGTPHEALAAFLRARPPGRTLPTSGSEVPQLFRTKNDVAGPQLADEDVVAALAGAGLSSRVEANLVGHAWGLLELLELWAAAAGEDGNRDRDIAIHNES